MAAHTRVLFPFASVALLVLAVLSIHAHPMADDWSYAHRSLTRPIQEWYIGDYLHWNGRYFSNLLVGSNPMVLGLQALPIYRCAPILLIVLTVFALRAFIMNALGTGLPARTAWALSIVLTSLQFHGMPDIGEGLYWYTGAVTYQTGNILLLLLLARCAARKAGVVNILLIAAIAGCSEVHMVLTFVLMVCVALVDRSREDAVGRTAWVGIAVTSVCAAIVVFAPGNSVRSAHFTGTHDVLHSGWMSLLQTLRFCATWLLDPALLLCSLIYFPLQRRWLAEHPITFRLSPWATTVGLGAVIFLCALPAYWGTGILGQHRTMNVAYCFFLLLWFANMSAWDIALLRKKWPQLRSLPIAVKALPVLAGAALLFTGNTGSALRDLLSGRAARFDQQLMARYALLEQARADGSEPWLPLIVDPPQALPLHDLRADPLDWMNQCYAGYFGIDGRPIHRAAAGDPATSQP